MARKNAIQSSVFIVILCLSLQNCRMNSEPQSVEARARKIHARILTLDTHCDTPLNLLRSDWKIGDRHDPALKGGGKIDLPRMVEGGLDAEFFAVFVAQGLRTPEGNAKAKETALKILEAIHAMARNDSDLVGLAFSPDDAYRLKKEGKRIVYIGMENGYPIGGDLSLIKKYYDRGVRYLTLCHTSDNDICDSSTDRKDPQDRGLSDFGKEVVLECNRLGLLVDISHVSDRSFTEVLSASRAPVIASHSCCRALCDNPRNLADDMLKALAEKSGVIQICFYPPYIKTPPPNIEREKALAEIEAKYERALEMKDEAALKEAGSEYKAIRRRYPDGEATVRDLVDHIDHVVKVVGVDHVGIGSDFDGGGELVGCEDVSGMIHVTEELIRRGYSEKEIEKIWSGNFMRVFLKAVEVSGRSRGRM